MLTMDTWFGFFYLQLLVRMNMLFGYQIYALKLIPFVSMTINKKEIQSLKCLIHFFDKSTHELQLGYVFIKTRLKPSITQDATECKA